VLVERAVSTYPPATTVSADGVLPRQDGDGEVNRPTFKQRALGDTMTRDHPQSDR